MITGMTPEEIRQRLKTLWDLYTAMPPIDEQKKGNKEKRIGLRNGDAKNDQNHNCKRKRGVQG
ncbi:MAG: hypothetical protein WA125_16670 [Desulfosporosinus sp.]